MGRRGSAEVIGGLRGYGKNALADDVEAALAERAEVEDLEYRKRIAVKSTSDKLDDLDRGKLLKRARVLNRQRSIDVAFDDMGDSERVVTEIERYEKALADYNEAVSRLNMVKGQIDG